MTVSSSSSALVSAPDAALSAEGNSDAFVQGFVPLLLASCLVLQRFALPVSGSFRLSLATPIVLGAVAWGLLTGKFMIDRNRAVLFLALLTLAAMSTVTRFIMPSGLAPRTSVPSLIHWLLLTAFAVVAFREPVPEERFFQAVNRWLAAIALAGMLQFALQFVGASVFSFSGIIPDQLLLEKVPFPDGYMTDQPLEYGSIIKKANGFFLLEPSIFAQFMAVGIMVETLYFRRLLRFAVFAGGMLVSVSGTGFLVLAAFGLALALSSGLRGLRTIGVMLASIGAVFLIAAVALPEVAQRLVERSVEVSSPGSSGYERFITPLMVMRDVLKASPWMPVIGIGPGTSEYLALPYKYFVNTPTKIVLEYGVVCFAVYLTLIISAERTVRQRILLLPMLVLLLLTGGYHQTAPLLFPVLLTVTVARLQRK